ncbi:hypothetical protein BD408DRAFT_422492 [Parasitella parasitica]|nr:hypothetical protein BD408DRAFT_422492 [Parasitella parasitica]
MIYRQKFVQKCKICINNQSRLNHLDCSIRHRVLLIRYYCSITYCIFILLYLVLS